jgi:type I restriction enzyme R subunit
LTEELRKNRTIDWQKKESARAGMRSKVKRLLKKYNYPPEEEQSALETVIHQCEQWADIDVNEYDYGYDTAGHVEGYAPKVYELNPEYHMAAEPEGPKYGSKDN